MAVRISIVCDNCGRLYERSDPIAFLPEKCECGHDLKKQDLDQRRKAQVMYMESLDDD